MFRRSFVFELLAATFLWLQSSATLAADAYFPLWQKNPPNATDTVLIYMGGQGRLPWTPAELQPYVSYTDSRAGKEKWLFDGFLFIEFHDGKRTFSADEGNGKWLPADKSEWQLLLNRNFQPGHGVSGLEETCAATEKRIGPPLRPRQVILTLPEPVDNFTNWGTIDGRKLDFSSVADREAACEWHINQALQRWHALAPKHLTLAGFYFVPESIGHSNPQLLPLVANYIHKQGLKLFWIPFWHAKHAADWQSLGFDLASQQPNYFFHPQLPESHLKTACDFARTNGMGMEMEFDDRMISQPTVYAPRFDSYLKAFADNGVRDSSSISYYEGGGTILHLASAGDKTVHAYYERIAQWVADRQQTADELERGNSSLNRK